jgi:hypothetical protein
MNSQQRKLRVQAAANSAVGVAATRDEESDDIEIQPLVQNPLGKAAAGDVSDSDDEEAHGMRRKSKKSRKSRKSRKLRKSRKSRKSRKTRKTRK